MDMRVNIPVRSRGWGFRGRRISHAAHPPPTNTNFPIGKKSHHYGYLRIKVKLKIHYFPSKLINSFSLTFPFQLKPKKQKLRREVEVFLVDNY